MDPITIVGTIIGAALASFVAIRQGTKKAEHQLMVDEGENGHTTARRLLNRIDDNVTQLTSTVGQLDGKADDLAKTLGEHGARIEVLEHFTGLKERRGK